MAAPKVQAVLPSDVEGTMRLDIDGGSATVPLKARVFSTGSAGFSCQTKVDGADGRRYQVSLNVILIGSKPTA